MRSQGSFRGYDGGMDGYGSMRRSDSMRRNGSLYSNGGYYPPYNYAGTYPAQGGYYGGSMYQPYGSTYQPYGGGSMYQQPSGSFYNPGDMYQGQAAGSMYYAANPFAPMGADEIRLDSEGPMCITLTPQGTAPPPGADFTYCRGDNMLVSVQALPNPLYAIQQEQKRVAAEKREVVSRIVGRADPVMVKPKVDCVGTSSLTMQKEHIMAPDAKGVEVPGTYQPPQPVRTFHPGLKKR